MGIELVPGTHVVVTCTACRHEVDLCCKRETGDVALNNAATKLLDAGWHRDGGKKWYCPDCSRHTHGR